MSKKAGGPAFPQPNQAHPGNSRPNDGPGMTQRQWFAGQALAGMDIPHDGKYSAADHAGGVPRIHAEWYAAAAYRIADAMLAEDEKS